MRKYRKRRNGEAVPIPATATEQQFRPETTKRRLVTFIFSSLLYLLLSSCYSARWAALRKLLYQFLDCERNTDGKARTMKQILSLGAGFDTTFFQLQDERKVPSLYVELDFKEHGEEAYVNQSIPARSNLLLLQLIVSHLSKKVTSKRAELIESYSRLRDKVSGAASLSREKGEGLKLRDIQKLVDIIAVAYMDPMYDADKLISSSPKVWRSPRRQNREYNINLHGTMVLTIGK